MSALHDRILDLAGGDPFGEVVREAELHREAHGAACGLFPAGSHVMRLVATIARAAAPRRVLDLGTGFGYSALWLASACEPGAEILGIDAFPEHVERAEALARHFGFADRLRFVAGDVGEVLDGLSGPFDFIHDDAWFAAAPPHLERAIELLRPGGTLTMANWFLLEDAISGSPRRDWSEFAGARWREDTLAYAEKLAREPRLAVTWCVSPPVGIAVRRGQLGSGRRPSTSSKS